MSGPKIIGTWKIMPDGLEIRQFKGAGLFGLWLSLKKYGYIDSDPVFTTDQIIDLRPFTVKAMGFSAHEEITRSHDPDELAGILGAIKENTPELRAEICLEHIQEDLAWLSSHGESGSAPDEIKRVLELHHSGESMAKIAENLDIAEGKVHRLIAENCSRHEHKMNASKPVKDDAGN